MHIPSLVKIHWCLLKLSSGNEKRTDGRTDGRTHGRQRETIIPRHYCVAGYKKEKKTHTQKKNNNKKQCMADCSRRRKIPVWFRGFPLPFFFFYTLFLSLLATASRLYAIAWGFLLRHKRIFITAIFIRALLLNQTQCGTITANWMWSRGIFYSFSISLT